MTAKRKRITFCGNELIGCLTQSCCPCNHTYTNNNNRFNEIYMYTFMYIYLYMCINILLHNSHAYNIMQTYM